MWLRSISQIVLGVAIAFSGIANAQTPAQDHDPSPPQPAPAGDSSQPDEPRVAPPISGGIRLPLIHTPEWFGTANARQRFGSISPDVGTWGISGDFSGNSRFGPVNPNAPWKANGGLTYLSNNGTVARLGFVGYGHYQISPVMTQMVGNGQDPTLPLLSFSDLSQVRVQWMLTASIEKTLIRIPGGMTIAGVADVFVPVNRASSSVHVPNTEAPPSITFRGGLKLRF